MKQQYKKFIWIGSIVIGLVFIYALLVQPVVARASRVSSEVKRQTKGIQSFLNIKRYPFGPPSAEVHQFILEDKALMEKAYEEAITRLNIKKEELLPEEGVQPSLYFQEKLAMVKRELSTKAAARQVQLEKVITFVDEEEVPPEEDIPELLRKLDIVKELVEIAISSQVKGIGEITITSLGKGEAAKEKIKREATFPKYWGQLPKGYPQEQMMPPGGYPYPYAPTRGVEKRKTPSELSVGTDEDEDFFEQLVVQFLLKSDVRTIVLFLNNLQKSNYFLIVDKMEVSSFPYSPELKTFFVAKVYYLPPQEAKTE